LYAWDGSQWSEQAKLTADDGASDDYFGVSVSIDALKTIVGAYRDNLSGSAYVYEWDGSQWILQNKLTASDGSLGDEFGLSVSISGDRAMVGSPSYDDTAGNQGAVYFYAWNGSQWLEQEKLIANDASSGDSFGQSVSINGGILSIGADGDDDAGIRTGSAYLLEWNGTQWESVSKLTASDAASRDQFGFAVANSGDWTIVGAFGDDDNGSVSGSVYAFDMTPPAMCNGLAVTVDLNAGDVPTSSDNVILGTPGVDIIFARGGNDTICAEGGDDMVYGGSGNDWIDGGPGNDQLTGNGGEDTIYGDIGNDEISGGGDADTISGEDGNDTLNGGTGDDTIEGLSGDDVISGGQGNDVIDGGLGIDTIKGGNGDDEIEGGDDTDTLRGNAGKDTILGGNGDDTLIGGSGDDDLNGNDGDDTISGGADNDMLSGGPGDDLLRGGTGDDELDGGASNGDECRGNLGIDTASAECEVIRSVP
jgi:Ca2+-binding RTX toxin-like protein